MAEHRWDTSTSAAAAEPGIPHAERRRWLLSFRAAVLAACLLLGTAAAFAVLRGGTPVEVSSVELEAADASASASAADAGVAGPSPASGGSGAAGAPSGGPASGADGSGESSSGAVASGGGTAVTGAPVLVVHVAGAVLQPGVVRVPGGSRTVDAVDAAGGAASDADLTAVNLAAALQDGSMVVVPRMGDPPGAAPGANPLPGNSPGNGGAGTGTASGTGSGSGSGTGVGTSTTGLVNLNTATLQELDTLPRVGPVIAERIVAWREAHGAFSRPEDLDAVPGIGEGMLASLLPLVTV